MSDQSKANHPYLVDDLLDPGRIRTRRWINKPRHKEKAKDLLANLEKAIRTHPKATASNTSLLKTYTVLLTSKQAERAAQLFFQLAVDQPANLASNPSAGKIIKMLSENGQHQMAFTSYFVLAKIGTKKFAYNPSAPKAINALYRCKADDLFSKSTSKGLDLSIELLKEWNPNIQKPGISRA